MTGHAGGSAGWPSACPGDRVVGRRPPGSRRLPLVGAVGGRRRTSPTWSRRPRRSGTGGARGSATASAGGSSRSSRRASPGGSSAPSCSTPPSTSTRRSRPSAPALLRDDVSFASPDEAIDTRLGDGSLFTTPRAFLEEEAAQHLERGDEGRYRWRYSPTAVIVAWSEMASKSTAVAALPDPRRGRRAVVDPGSRPAPPHLQSLPVPGGHSVLWDDFEATAAAVEEFLAR